ncbi:hypothetical protein DH2020_014159 [Rehmannia glutinosa]|uniref:Tf2-1-like SH3-like domain-containing protein n=1 Tax=Rehmannia glutinosa TaxID=99300 RepID=A0ABR0WWH4_REHGL
MALYEALYGRKCRSPLHRKLIESEHIEKTDFVQETTEAVKVIRKRIEIAQSRQKSYVDVRRRSLEFSVGDFVFIKVSPMKGIMRFGKKGKLSPRYVGPYMIVERIGKVAYKLELPQEMTTIHNVFHVSMLKKYIPDPSHVLTPQLIQIDESFSYEEKPTTILDRGVKKLRNKEIPLVKVLWSNHKVEEATWEREEDIRAKYPHLFRV